MLWLTSTIVSYFFTAISNTVDKVVVSRLVPRPSVYAWYVGIAQALAVVLIPFGVHMPTAGTGGVFLIELLAGIAFIAALLLMYAALSEGETSRVIPVIGGSIPLVTLIFASVLLRETLSNHEAAALLLLVVGIILITYQHRRARHHTYHFARYAVSAGVLFALCYTLTKFSFSNDTWINAFFWMRMGSFLAALIIYAVPGKRALIRADLRKPKRTKALVVLGNQLVGGIGFTLLNYAISLGSVTLTNALQALQYVFVFLLAAVFGRFFPELRERYTPVTIAQKIAATCFIAAGLYILT